MAIRQELVTYAEKLQQVYTVYPAYPAKIALVARREEKLKEVQKEIEKLV